MLTLKLLKNLREGTPSSFQITVNIADKFRCLSLNLSPAMEEYEYDCNPNH